MLVGEQCDRYVEGVVPTYRRGHIAGVIRDSLACKARLLHYFPPNVGEDDDTWCGWHNDHGTLTGAVISQSSS